MSSVWQSRLSLSIFGQSHGPAIGMTLDGIPAGEPIDTERLQAFLNRRAPGRFPWATPRKELDIPEFLSGIVNGKTCGAPITAVIRNENTRPADYAKSADVPRPGHADFTAHVKHGGFQDASGGGHFSGRLTAALCIAGGVCLQVLARRGVTVGAHIVSVADVSGKTLDPVNVDELLLTRLTAMDFPVLTSDAAPRMIEAIAAAKAARDSVGGVIECAAVGLPPGLGDPLFGGMENRLAALLFAVPAIKGVEFGAGFEAARMRGSEHNDPFYYDGETVKTRSNHHGGILGGITSGMPLLLRVAVKPTPSVGKEQESISLSGKASEALTITGRHDPCVVPRAVPCIEAAAAVAILDAMI
ncbi:MAG: chorismate synthase [Defluviitaleaceae bacterium]|nr:chorismate synthase [Defluviitaleaceae bacterium]